MKHATAMLAAVLLLGCSNPVYQWEGQGVGFREAADKAAHAHLDASPFHYVGLSEVRFKWDDAGAQREGRVTVYMDGSTVGWFVAPGQCEYAPAGACADPNALTVRDMSRDVVLEAYKGKDCSSWPTVCEMTGLRLAAPGENCPSIYGGFCPVYTCYNPCEVATAAK